MSAKPPRPSSSLNVSSSLHGGRPNASPLVGPQRPSPLVSPSTSPIIRAPSPLFAALDKEVQAINSKAAAVSLSQKPLPSSSLPPRARSASVSRLPSARVKVLRLDVAAANSALAGQQPFVNSYLNTPNSNPIRSSSLSAIPMLHLPPSSSSAAGFSSRSSSSARSTGRIRGHSSIDQRLEQIEDILSLDTARSIDIIDLGFNPIGAESVVKPNSSLSSLSQRHNYIAQQQARNPSALANDPIAAAAASSYRLRSASRERGSLLHPPSSSLSIDRSNSNSSFDFSTFDGENRNRPKSSSKPKPIIPDANLSFSGLDSLASASSSTFLTAMEPEHNFDKTLTAIDKLMGSFKDADPSAPKRSNLMDSSMRDLLKKSKQASSSSSTSSRTSLANRPQSAPPGGRSGPKSVENMLQEYINDPDKQAALAQRVAQHTKVIKDKKLKHGKDLIAINKDFAVHNSKEEQEKRLKDRAQGLNSRVNTTIERKLQMDEERRQRILADIERDNKRREEADKERAAVRHKQLQQDFAMKWMFLVMVGSRTRAWGARILMSRTLREKNDAARVLQRALFAYVQRKRRLRREEAVRKLMRHKYMISRYVMRIRKKIAIRVIRSFLGQSLMAIKIQKAVKTYTQQVIRCQRITRRFLRKRRARLIMMAMQYSLIEARMLWKQRKEAVKHMPSSSSSAALSSSGSSLSLSSSSSFVHHGRGRSNSGGSSTAQFNHPLAANNKTVPLYSECLACDPYLLVDNIKLLAAPRQYAQILKTPLSIKIDVLKEVYDVRRSAFNKALIVYDGKMRMYWEQRKANDMLRGALTQLDGGSAGAALPSAAAEPKAKKEPKSSPSSSGASTPQRRGSRTPVIIPISEPDEPDDVDQMLGIKKPLRPVFSLVMPSKSIRGLIEAGWQRAKDMLDKSVHDAESLAGRLDLMDQISLVRNFISEMQARDAKVAREFKEVLFKRHDEPAKELFPSKSKSKSRHWGAASLAYGSDHGSLAASNNNHHSRRDSLPPLVPTRSGR